jgi:hypothetical protein
MERPADTIGESDGFDKTRNKLLQVKFKRSFMRGWRSCYLDLSSLLVFGLAFIVMLSTLKGEKPLITLSPSFISRPAPHLSHA